MVDFTPPLAITQLLTSWGEGDQKALNAVFPQLYSELRKVAHSHLRRNRKDHTLQTTGLVHETYLRLDKYRSPQLQNRNHFVAICALLMRQVLMDYERTRMAAKRGGGQQKIALDDFDGAANQRPVDLLALDLALEELAKLDPTQSRIVELRYFGGLSVEEVADVLKISTATVKRYWATAKVWLYQELSGHARP